MVELIPYRNEIIEAIKMLYNFIITKWLKQYLIGGIVLDRLILQTILQTNTVLKLMRYLASSLPVMSRGGKKNPNPNPLAHPNPPTNCPPKPIYLINGQMGVSPIRPN